MGRELWISPTSLGMYMRCPFSYYLRYGLGQKMWSNINFALGRAVHSVFDIGIRQPKKITKEQMMAQFKSSWENELDQPMYLREKDDLDATFALGVKISELMVDDILGGKLPFRPVKYLDLSLIHI